MKLMDVENWSQKKLKFTHVMLLALYGVLAFLGPIIGSIIMTSTTGQIEQKWRAPIIVVVIVIAILIVLIIKRKKGKKINKDIMKTSFEGDGLLD